MASISSPNHWWQNWSKTHAYIAERMFFPRNADDIAWAIQQAETLQRPIRAVGGGWSFSDASLPGSVTTNRPNVHGVEAMAQAVPRSVTFPPPSPIPSNSIASIPAGTRAPDGTRESSELFDRPSVSLGRIIGGDAMNKVPDCCAIDVDIRFLPGQSAAALLADIEAIPDTTASVVFHRDPAIVERDNPYVQLLADSVGDGVPSERISIGRDGASDIVSFLEAGTPGVEFGPIGGGHHGPEEWVSISSLERYRHSLVEFVNAIPKRLGAAHLRIA